MSRIYTTSDFIKKAKEIHGDKYDYSKTQYINAKTKVIIICKIHGEFTQNPHNHISSKSGCPKCSKNHNRYTNESFIDIVKQIHNNKYDYSLVNYINGRTKIKIKCPIHGIFEQSPMKHLQGQGCPLCGKINTSMCLKKSDKQFIQDAKKVHGNKYDYSLVKYINAYKKIKIICPKHGIFEQTPHHHLNKHGCPKCKMSTLETEIFTLLEENKINFVWQYRNKWLGRQSLDFYLPDYNIAIECQGEQHYQKIFYRSKKWNEEKSEKNFNKIIKLDNEKYKKCLNNKIVLYYFSKTLYDSVVEIFNDKNKLLNKILEKKNEMG